MPSHVNATGGNLKAGHWQEYCAYLAGAVTHLDCGTCLLAVPAGFTPSTAFSHSKSAPMPHESPVKPSKPLQDAAPDAVAVDGEVAAEGDEWQSSGLDLEFVPETPRGAKRVGVAQEGVANVWTEKKISRLDLRCEDLEDWLKQNGRQDIYKLTTDRKGKPRALCLICPPTKEVNAGFVVSRTSFAAIHHHEKYTVHHEKALAALPPLQQPGGSGSLCSAITPFQFKPCSEVSQSTDLPQLCDGLQLIGCQSGIFCATEVHPPSAS